MTTQSKADRQDNRRAWSAYAGLVVVCVVIFAAVAYIVSQAQTKSYSAESSITVQDPVLAVTGSASTAQTPAALAAVEAQRVTGLAVSRAVAARIGNGYSPAAVANATTTYVDPTSNAIDITSSTHSAVLAARIANAFAEDDAEETNGAVEREYAAQVQEVKRTIETLDTSNRSDGVPAALASTLVHDEQLATSAQEVQLAHLASPPTGASAPKTTRNVGIVAVIGLIVGVILADLLIGSRIRRRRTAQPSNS